MKTLCYLLVSLALVASAYAKRPNLARAAGNGDMESVKKILAEYPEIIKELEKEKELVLRYAAEYNKPKMIEFLISKGADVNQVDEHGSTALYYALASESIEAAKTLVEKGAKLNIQDESKSTILHVVAQANNIKAVTYLLEQKDDSGKPLVKIDLLNRWNHTPLTYALRHTAEFQKESILLLIKAGADCKVIDRYKDTPLHHAAKHKDASEVIQLLVKNGADLNALNRRKQPPLYYAVKEGNTKVVETLLSLGATVDDLSMKQAEEGDNNTIISLLDKHRK